MSLLPRLPGIYIFLSKNKEILYVGKAKSLFDRVRSYFHGSLSAKTEQLVSRIDKISFIQTNSETDALILEAQLIKKYLPKYNIDLKDGKNYPLIEINYQGKIPYVTICRKKSFAKNKYFGPYPTGSDVNAILRWIRRVFPFVSVKNHPNKKCLYADLGLCPCSDFSDYPKNLKNIQWLLSGRKPGVVRSLKTEMATMVKNLEFEKAANLKTKIEFLTLSNQTKKWDYQTNPNLVSEVSQKQVQSLCETLGIPFSEGFRIEGYDISHTSGKEVVGSLVSFLNGQPEKKNYRRFKIKLDSNNDYLALKEVLGRRLKHPEWPMPNLILIDGGIGQLSSVGPIDAPVVSLAKREELIFTQNQSIRLPKSDPGLQLLMAVRDEAHRFGQKYHFLLRRKNLLYFKK